MTTNRITDKSETDKTNRFSLLDGPIPLEAWTRKTKEQIEWESKQFTIGRLAREVNETIATNRAEREHRKQALNQPQTCNGSGRAAALGSNACPVCGRVFETMEWSSQGAVIPRH